MHRRGPFLQRTCTAASPSASVHDQLCIFLLPFVPGAVLDHMAAYNRCSGRIVMADPPNSSPEIEAYARLAQAKPRSISALRAGQGLDQFGGDAVRVMPTGRSPGLARRCLCIRSAPFGPERQPHPSTPT